MNADSSRPGGLVGRLAARAPQLGLLLRPSPDGPDPGSFVMTSQAVDEGDVRPAPAPI
jgi:hypothetical protein